VISGLLRHAKSEEQAGQKLLLLIGKLPSVPAILLQDPFVYILGVPLLGLFIAGLVMTRWNYRLGFTISLASLLVAYVLTVHATFL
jgi:hypothetical protein